MAHTKKVYSAPLFVEYGDAITITADSRNSDADDTFFDRNGQPQGGLGGSNDTCVTADRETCHSDG